MNSTAHRIRSSVWAAGAGLLLATGGVALAPAAFAAPADASEPPQLTVSTSAPAEVGLAGQPVAFTTQVANTGTFDSPSTRLVFRADGGAGLPPNALILQYRLSGTAWKSVPLTYSGSQFAGELPETFSLDAGKSRSVQMRIGLPMGTPHDGDSNGGTDHLKLTTLVSYGAAGAANDMDEDTIKVDAPATSLSGVPATVTAGGAAVTFTATLDNPTASGYDNVTETLITNRYAGVQVLRGGTWTTLQPRTSAAEPDIYGFDVVGKDASLTAHGSTATKVRLTYRKGAPTGATTIHSCVFVNQGSMPFLGTTFCGKEKTLTVRAAGSGAPTPTASATHPTASATPSATSVAAGAGTASGTSGTTSQLAETGSGGMSATAGTAGVLALSGAGALGFVAMRRRARA